MMDRSSWYNQIIVHTEDRHKTTSTTPWGTFMHEKIPFGLINIESTFQHTMDIAFTKERDMFTITYLDDRTIFSKLNEEHLVHLR